MWALLLAVSLVVSEAVPRGPLSLRGWLPIGPEAAAVDEIVADPRDARVVYAIGDDRLWRTRDGGKSWVRIADDPGFHYFNSLAMDESDPDTLYVITDGLRRSDDGGEKLVAAGVGVSTYLTFGTSVSAAQPSRLYTLTGGGDLLTQRRSRGSLDRDARRPVAPRRADLLGAPRPAPGGHGLRRRGRATYFPKPRRRKSLGAHRPGPSAEHSGNRVRSRPIP